MLPQRRHLTGVRKFTPASLLIHKLIDRQTDLPKIRFALRRPRDARAYCTAGSSSAIKMPMIAITTSSSTSVNPFNIAAFRVHAQSLTGPPRIRSPYFQHRALQKVLESLRFRRNGRASTGQLPALAALPIMPLSD